jgi:hypothetical protein
MPGESAEIWTTMKMEAEKSGGRLPTIVLAAAIAPAEPPMTTISLGCNRSPFQAEDEVCEGPRLEMIWPCVVAIEIPDRVRAYTHF